MTFTPLEAPHLPAREQREEELRLHKKGQVRGAARRLPAAVPPAGRCRRQGVGERPPCSQAARPAAVAGAHGWGSHELWSPAHLPQRLADSADLTDRQPAFLKDKGDALFKQVRALGSWRRAASYHQRPTPGTTAAVERATPHATTARSLAAPLNQNAIRPAPRLPAAPPPCPRPQGNIAGAVHAYGRALLLDPPPTLAAPLLSNRAAALLKAGDAAGARADCGAALHLVKAELDRLTADGSAVAAAPPPASSSSAPVCGCGGAPAGAGGNGGGGGGAVARLQGQAARLLARRAAAAAQQGDLAAAECDLLEAIK